MLAFLEKLTLTPSEVTPIDVQALREAHVNNRAVEDAVHICAIFNIINRVADALGFEH